MNTKVMEYWDIDGILTADDDPEQAYQDYLFIYGDVENPLTLKDFQQHIEYLQNEEAIND